MTNWFFGSSTMRRNILKRLVAVSLLFIFICLLVFLLLHNSLSRKPDPVEIDAELWALSNHETRKPKHKTTALPPHPQIHVKNIPPPKVHLNMTLRQAEYQFFSFLEDKSIRCENDIRLGNMHDGGWNVCMSPPFTFTNPCVVFSFGTSFDWQFEDSVAKIYGCRVLAFNPRMKEPDVRRSPLIEFRPVGIGAFNDVTEEGWRRKTLGTHLQDEGYWGTPVDYVKLDVEFDEWDILRTALQEGALKYVKQLGFEAHSRHLLLSTDRKEMEREKERRRTVDRKTREMEEKVDFVHMYETIRQIEISHFRKFNYRKNPFGNYRSNFTGKGRSSCYELHYVNVDFLLGNQTVMHAKDSKLFH